MGSHRDRNSGVKPFSRRCDRAVLLMRSRITAGPRTRAASILDLYITVIGPILTFRPNLNSCRAGFESMLTCEAYPATWSILVSGHSGPTAAHGAVISLVPDQRPTRSQSSMRVAAVLVPGPPLGPPTHHRRRHTQQWRPRLRHPTVAPRAATYYLQPQRLRSRLAVRAASPASGV